MAQLPPLEFAPPHSSTPSPSVISPGAFLPPNKRQKLSPQPYSPQNSPGPLSQSISLPGYAQHQYQQPQQHLNGEQDLNSRQGNMGPPSKPPVVNPANLTDVLEASGIDLAAEEANLTQSFNATAESFNSTHSAGSNGGTVSGHNSFNEYYQQSYGGHGSYYANGGNFAAPPLPYKSSEEIAEEQRQAAIRAQAVAKQYHLEDPFLQGYPLRAKVQTAAYNSGVGLPFDKDQLNPNQSPELGRYQTKKVTGSDGVAVTSIKGQLVSRDAAMAEILALLSLAARERVRGLVEDAVAIAKGRQLGSQGVVPVEWQDLATASNGDILNGTKAHTGDESIANPSTNPLKRNLSSISAPVLTVPNTFVKALRSRQQSDRNTEESRIRKRLKRSSAASTPATTPSTPIVGDRAPEAEIKKLSKKEQAKANNARHDEAYQHKSANATASHMLSSGGGLFGKKTYSWMTAGKTAAVPAVSRSSTGGPGKTSDSGSPAAVNLTPGFRSRMGEFREDTQKGAGVQLRDLIAIIEADGKALKPLAKANLLLK